MAKPNRSIAPATLSVVKNTPDQWGDGFANLADAQHLFQAIKNVLQDTHVDADHASDQPTPLTLTALAEKGLQASVKAWSAFEAIQDGKLAQKAEGTTAEPGNVTNEDITSLHPRLWEAQTICRMLDDYARLYVGHESVEQDQIKCDIQHAARIIGRLIEEAHDSINELEQKTIDGRAGKEAPHD